MSTRVRILMSIALVVFSVAVLVLASQGRQYNGAEAVAEESIQTATYDELVPYMEHFTHAVNVEGYGLIVQVCPNLDHSFSDVREELAYWAINNMLDQQPPNHYPLEAHVKDPGFPKGLYDKPDIRKLMEPALAATREERLAIHRQEREEALAKQQAKKAIAAKTSG